MKRTPETPPAPESPRPHPDGAAHTTGPWTVETDVAQNGDIHIFSPGLCPIAMVDCREEPDDDDYPPRETALANAAVMAAAPDLLDALRAFCGDYESVPLKIPELQAAYHYALSVIARAEGRS